MAEFPSPNSFEEILSGEFDPLGLLQGVKPAAKRSKGGPATVKNFEQILEFHRTYGRVPELNAKSVKERALAARLASFRANPKLRKQVEHLDQPGLLVLNVVNVDAGRANAEPEEAKPFSSFADLLQNDDSGLLADVDTSIFRMEHVEQGAHQWKNLPEEVAKRKPCEDFFKYERLFDDMQKAIDAGKAVMGRFKNGTTIEVGDFFIVNGILCYVESVLKASVDRHKADNHRLRVIFANGVEIDILKHSLAKALYRDENGRRVFRNDVELVGAQELLPSDKPTGCVYVLESETKAPELVELKLRRRLVKIGYSSQSVEERVMHAADDPTYLEAPVRIIASLDCFNMNPQKFEKLIHAFLANQRLNITLISSKGERYRPTEWFAVDAATAIAVAEHIVAGDIMNYRMDNTTGRLKQILGK